MRILSVIFYLLSAHSGATIPIFILLCALPSIVLALWRKHKGWYALGIIGLVIGPLDVFAGPFANSLFLNAVGVEGTGVIVHKRETNTMLNNAYVWEYNVVLKAQDGTETATTFRTDNANIYPIRNEILIPPQDQTFIMKYVPGFERNFVIMSDESDYGKQRKVDLDLEPVRKAAAQLKVSPDNPAFRKEYCKSLQTFLAAHRNDVSPDMIHDIEEDINNLCSSAGQ